MWRERWKRVKLTNWEHAELVEAVDIKLQSIAAGGGTHWADLGSEEGSEGRAEEYIRWNIGISQGITQWNIPGINNLSPSVLSSQRLTDSSLSLYYQARGVFLSQKFCSYIVFDRLFLQLSPIVSNQFLQFNFVSGRKDAVTGRTVEVENPWRDGRMKNGQTKPDTHSTQSSSNWPSCVPSFLPTFWSNFTPQYNPLFPTTVPK